MGKNIPHDFVSQFEALQQDVKIIHEKINMLLEKAKVKWDDKSEVFVGIVRQTTSQSITDNMMRAGSSMDYHGDENNDEDGLGDDDDENDDDADGEEPPFDDR